jgi:hypothetical protein
MQPMSVQFIQHEGRRLLFMDFSGHKDPAVVVKLVEEARAFVAALPKRKEHLTLVNVGRIRFNEAVLKAFRGLIKHDEPWEIAVSVYGLTGLGLIAFRAQNLLTGGRMRGFAERSEALFWLGQQARTEA